MNRWPLTTTNFWESAPFFRLMVPFVVGIFCYYKFGLLPHFQLWGGITLLVAFIFYLVFSLQKREKSIVVVGHFLALNFLLFGFGYSLAMAGDTSLRSNYFGNYKGKQSVFLARINSTPIEKEHTWKLSLDILKVIKDGQIQTVEGEAFIYVYKDMQLMLYHKGDTLMVPGGWERITNSGNPYEFDYARYCSRNNLLYRQTCHPKDISLYASSDPSKASLTDKCHDWCMAGLNKYITEPRTKGLIQAMLIGDEINLDEDLRQSYAETGIIHIISISGGNVSIFFIAIAFLFRWQKSARHHWLRYVVALPLVWFYILMAGAPPSAVRAAIMFSLLAFSVIFQKNNHSLNTLFTTAFLLLCFRPMWLFSVGFQLSFVAVLSLILFYPAINKLVKSKHKIVNWLWSGVAASLAAEILVAPIVIYYFHTFPLFFIVANFAAFLFMNIVLILGMCIIGFSFIPIFASSLGWLTTWLVVSFNKIVALLQGLNPERLLYLRLSLAEMLLLYLVIIGLGLFLMRQKKPALFLGLSMSCLLMGLFCVDAWGHLVQNKLVVYNVSKSNYLEQFVGSKYRVIQSDTTSPKRIKYAVKPSHIEFQTLKMDSASIPEYLETGGKTILILNKPITVDAYFPVDYLILNYPSHPYFEQLNKVFSPKMIILGNNYTRTNQAQIADEAKNLGVLVHFVGINGALVIE